MSAVLARLVPGSLAGRFALGSAVLVVLTLIAASIGTGFVLSRFIRVQLDQRLDVQIAAITTALTNRDANGDLKLADGPPFDRPQGGWYWTAELGGRVYRSASLQGADIRQDADSDVDNSGPRGKHALWDGDGRPGFGPRPFDGLGPRDEPLYLRVETVPVAGDWAKVTVAAPAHALFRPLRDALVPVIVSILALGLLLAVASIVQLRLGLRPLGRLTAQLEAVRAGKAERIEGPQPRELQPLVGEVNSLIEQNAEGLERARGHVSNLGHALNTPLAALALTLGKSAKDAERRELVEEMQARIRHHLGRARAAALRGSAHAATPVRERLDDIVAALGKIHAERGIAADNAIPAGLVVACEPQDLDEMLGNLLDNAVKWAKGRVSISSRSKGGDAVLVVEDDGPGVDADRLAEIVKRGRRLDETVPGHGFGLAITRELAELYGGSLALANGSAGGLRVELTLPARMI